MLDTGHEVRDELRDGTPVEDGTGNTLSDQDAVLLGKVASSARVASLAVLTATGLLVLHCGNGTHATVGLDKLALVADEVLTRRLGCTGQKTTHHDSAGTHGQTLDDVTNILDTTVSDTRNAEASGKGGDAANSGGLWTTDSHNLLGDASAAAAHANSQAIGTGGNQRSSLLPGNNVTGDHIDLGEGLLDELDHLNLVRRVALAAVENDNIQASLDEQLEAGLVLLTSTDRSSTNQLLGVGELRSQRVVQVLHQIRARQERNEVSGGINDGQLALLRLAEDLVGLGQSSTSRGSDQVSGHYGSDGVAELVVELNVTGSNHANELGAEGPVLCCRQM